MDSCRKGFYIVSIFNSKGLRKGDKVNKLMHFFFSSLVALSAHYGLVPMKNAVSAMIVNQSLMLVQAIFTQMVSIARVFQVYLLQCSYAS